ncbi:CRISPR-associated helicase Cas3' [Tunicatimonas pelagia]|uniref:CRISPR-associated helicase Cas3' n=1 Tax=Tunicatimonas pelagia TaxID=931531 RepID=UPI002665A288|nr:CRISPR-associated helicase Cas3' [Tunicatimonas pelagia]WKN44268.1 CRISPR-associated helicase Cas3' [Tunicatimonas pelagia]
MIYSHPNVPLIHHLQIVGNNCRQLILERKWSVDVDISVIADLSYIAGALHDIGKATKFFQHYLLTESHEIIGPKNHALISALLAYKVCQAYTDKVVLEERDKLLLPIFVFTAVKRHHGKIGNYDNELLRNSEKSEELIEQAANFSEGSFKLYEQLIPSTLAEYSWDNFLQYVSEQEFESELADFFFDELENGFHTELLLADKTKYFYLHQLLYSTLLFADKSDVLFKNEVVSKNRGLDYNALQKFREAKKFDNPSDEIDRRKNEAYFSSIENVRRIFNPNQHLYSLTLPTGLGKTITSLGVALTLKEILNFPTSKIIITIPFTSIIDQNYEVFQEIFNYPDSNVLLKHHHLAEPSYKEGEDEFDSQKSQFLMETWQSEIVVTTFVQLLETMFTNDKTKLLKFPNLMNGIIILDEVQQINYQLWPLIRQAFDVLGQKYNCYFLLMSATQPLIFEPEKEITEVVPDFEKYFSYFNRTCLVNRADKKVSFDKFSVDVINYLHNHPDRNVLIILNTKQKTRELFERLASVESESDVYYLSTLITPYERKKIIALIKEKNTRKRKVIVSTQLVEAGVDISVHTVFRAQAPLDAIIQAAGRANRYNENPQPAEVYLYQIEELQKASSLIYGRDLLIKTSNVLKGVKRIEEQDYLELIKRYFQEVHIQSQNVTSDISDAIAKLQFDSVGKFKFIEDQNTESIFIQLNDQAITVWSKFTDIYDNENLNKYEKKAAFSKLKATFYDFVINAPIPYDQKEIDFDSEKTKYHFYLSEFNNPSSFYSYNEDDYSQNIGYHPRSIMHF